MQTFLPYPSFVESAKCLDDKRLGKQRVECKQILVALGIRVGKHAGNPMSRWRHHPAVRMWRGGELHLCEYAWWTCYEWRSRGFKDSLLPQFVESRLECWNWRKVHERPAWLGGEAFHASHRSNLLRKSKEHYAAFGWTEDDTLAYVWPV